LAARKELRKQFPRLGKPERHFFQALEKSRRKKVVSGGGLGFIIIPDRAARCA
jgi:hypothetical protein